MSRWADQSGNRNDAVQATATRQIPRVEEDCGSPVELERVRGRGATHHSRLPGQSKSMSDRHEPGERRGPSKRSPSWVLWSALSLLFAGCASGMKPTARASDTAREPQGDTPPTNVTDTAVTTPDDAGMDTDVSEDVSQSQPIADGGRGPTHPHRSSGSATPIAFDAGSSAGARDGGTPHPFPRDIAFAQMIQGAKRATSCGATIHAVVSVEFSNTGSVVKVFIKRLEGAQRESQRGIAAIACIEAAFQQAQIPAYVGKRETMEWSTY